MHNGAKNTPAALPSIIKGIQDKGFEIVLIKDLIPEGEYYTDVQGELHLSN
jgi:peptidoglycan/xylan/chitin deacetylase (PgdA/CDA1 family)